MQPVLKELRRVAEREVVAVVAVVRDDAVGIDRRGREVGLVLFSSARKRHGIRIDMARFEKLIGRITRAGRIVQLRAPTVDRRSRHRSVAARAVTVLELRHHEGRQELRLARIGHLELSGLPLLRRDHDGAVRRTRPVKSRRRSARQHRDRLDVLGVQVRNGLRGTPRIEFRAAPASDVVHRNAVDHIEGIRRLEDRLRTAHDNLRGTADTRRRGVDRHTGDLARQRVHEVGVLDHRDVRRRDLLDVVREGLFLTFDAEGRHHDLFDLRGGFAQRYVEVRARADRHTGRFTAQIADLQLPEGRRGRDLQFETAPGVGRDPHGGSPHDDRCPDHRASRSIEHPACNPCGSGLRFFGKDDIGLLEIILDRRALHHLIQHFADRPVGQVEG